MKFIKLKKIFLIIIMFLAACGSAFAVNGADGGGVKLLINGVETNISPKIIKKDGEAYIPVMAASKLLYGAFADYSRAAKTITAVNRHGAVFENKINTGVISSDGAGVTIAGSSFAKSWDYYVTPEFISKVFDVTCGFSERTGTVAIWQPGETDAAKLPAEVRELGEAALMRHYQPEYLKRYIKYKRANPDFDYFDVVTYVNIGLDFPFYSDLIKKQVKNPDSYFVLCNKYNYLPEDYVPDGYKKSDGRVLALRGDAREQYEKMRADALKSGVNIYIISGYRSYAVQNQVYNNYKRGDPAGADIYSARPGHSEHQTGLAADFNAASASARFEETKEYAWLDGNAHKYGFILRYPKNKEWITGYMFEPWHWRYVGARVAGIIKEDGLTYDEYCAIYRVPQNYILS